MLFAVNKTLRNLIVLTMISSTAHSIDERTALVGAIAGGAAVGIGAGTSMYLGVFGNSSNQATRSYVSGIAGLVVGGTTGYYFYKWLYKLTPTNRVALASALVHEVATDSLSIEFAKEDDFDKYVSMRFSGGCALVLSKQELSNSLNKLTLALSTIDFVQKQITKDVKYKLLVQQCSLLTEKIISLSSIIENNLNIVMNHRDYGAQAQLYDQQVETKHICQYQEFLKSIIGDKNAQKNSEATPNAASA
jgi:hypothetical protein